MTSMYEEGLKLLDEKFGNGKDNLFPLQRSPGNRVLTESLARLSGVWMPIMKTAHFILLHMENQIKCCK